MKRLVLAALALIIACGAAYYLLVVRGGKDIAEYATAEVARGDITSHVSATGTINPKRSVMVGSEVSGTIREIRVDNNSRVQKGDVLLKLDQDLLSSEVIRAQAAVDMAVARLAELDATRRLKVVEIESGLSSASAETADAETRLGRSKGLYEKGVISKEELDAIDREYAVKAAALELAGSGEDKLGVLDSQIASAKAQEADARGRLVTALTNIKKTVITSPMDGVVINKGVEVGQTVAASFNTPELLTIGDLGVMEVEVSIDEADVGRVSVGMDAEFTVDAYPGKKYIGKVSRVNFAPAVVQNVVTYAGIIEVENDDLSLRPGMTANVEIITSRRSDVILIPSAALRVKLDLPKADGEGRTGGGNKTARPDGLVRVYVLEAGNPKPVMVKPGETDYTNTEILSGLSLGDLVVTESASGGKDGGQGRMRMRGFH